MGNFRLALKSRSLVDSERACSRAIWAIRQSAGAPLGLVARALEHRAHDRRGQMEGHGIVHELDQQGDRRRPPARQGADENRDVDQDLLNTAEGCGRRARRDRGRFFSMARGSAMECGAIVDIVEVRRCAPVVAVRQARAVLVRIVSMLTKLELRTRR
ncbi:MAG: four helix bundle protein [Vicinamibacteria bacterium]